MSVDNEIKEDYLNALKKLKERVEKRSDRYFVIGKGFVVDEGKKELIQSLDKQIKQLENGGTK